MITQNFSNAVIDGVSQKIEYISTSKDGKYITVKTYNGRVVTCTIDPITKTLTQTRVKS